MKPILPSFAWILGVRWLAAAGCSFVITACAHSQDMVPATPVDSTAPEPPAADAGTKPASAQHSNSNPTVAQPKPDTGLAVNTLVAEPTVLGPCRYTAAVFNGKDDAPSATASPSINYGAFRQKKQIWVGQGGLVQAALNSNEDSLLVLSDQDGVARTYSLPEAKPGPSYAYPGHEILTRLSVAWWPNSSSEILVGSDRGIQLVTLGSSAEPRSLSSARSWGLDWDRTGTILGSVSAKIPEQTGVLTFFEAAVVEHEPQLSELARLDCEERVDGWALSRDRAHLLVTHYPSNHVALYDLKEGRELWRIPGPAFAGSVDISPDGTLGAVGGDQVWVFPLATPDKRATFTKLGNNVNQVRFSPDSIALAVAAYDGKARLLSTKLAEPDATKSGTSAALSVFKVLAHSGTANVYPVTFSRDGRLLITSSGDQTVRLWSN